MCALTVGTQSAGMLKLIERAHLGVILRERNGVAAVGLGVLQGAWSLLRFGSIAGLLPLVVGVWVIIIVLRGDDRTQLCTNTAHKPQALLPAILTELPRLLEWSLLLCIVAVPCDKLKPCKRTTFHVCKAAGV